MSKSKIAVIYNAKSGSALSAKELTELFQKVSIQPELIKLAPSLESDVKKAYEAGTKTFVAVGGDGTINAVANEVIKHNATLGVLPLGTLNHFAKDLSIPTDHEKAVKVIAKGQTKKVDTARVNDKLFLNNSSIGLYPLLVREREKEEDAISKWPAAVVAFFHTLRKQRTYSVTLQIDSEKLEVTTPFIFIGNNSYNLNTPGALHRHTLTGGNLTVSIVKTTNTLQMLRIALDVAIGKPDLSGYFDTHQAKKLTITAKEKHLDVAFDGETKQIKTPLRYSIEPKSLTVITPR